MYIVIETFDPIYSSIVTNEDGETKLFDTKAEAQAEADECQDGKVVEL